MSAQLWRRDCITVREGATTFRVDSEMQIEFCTHSILGLILSEVYYAAPKLSKSQRVTLRTHLSMQMVAKARPMKFPAEMWATGLPSHTCNLVNMGWNPSRLSFPLVFPLPHAEAEQIVLCSLYLISRLSGGDKAQSRTDKCAWNMLFTTFRSYQQKRRLFLENGKTGSISNRLKRK